MSMKHKRELRLYECSETTKRDVGDLMMILDSLSEVDVIQRPATARDVPPHF